MSDDRHPSPSSNSGNGDECSFVRENAAGFALRSLTPAENERILQHVATHPECLQIVKAEVAVVELLPFGMPLIEAPDLAVRLKLMDRIDAERNAPLEKTTHAGPVQFFAPQFNPVPSPLTITAPTAATPSRRLQNFASVLLAPLCVALLVMSVWAYNLNDEVRSLREPAPTIDSQTLMSSMEVYTMTSPCTNCSTRGQIGALPDQTSALLLAWNLDPAEDHEVWCEERDGNKWMISPLTVNANGAAIQTIKFPKPIEGYSRIYVSGSDNDSGEDPELLVAMPEQHEDNPPSQSTPSA